MLQKEASNGKFFSYIAGVAYQIQSRYSVVTGAILEIYKADLPVKKGLSSSGAVCVLTARAFNRLYQLTMQIEEEMELAYLGERTTPSKCGQMDQVCIYGNQLNLITFQKDQYPIIQPIHNRKTLFLVIVDLHGEKDTVEILAQLQNVFSSTKLNSVRSFLENTIEYVIQAKNLLTNIQEEFDRQVSYKFMTKYLSVLTLSYRYIYLELLFIYVPNN